MNPANILIFPVSPNDLAGNLLSSRKKHGTGRTEHAVRAAETETETMSHRILLVDDEVDILEFVRYNLVREGYEVFTAENGAQALQVAAACRPHLILLDMMMPVIQLSHRPGLDAQSTPAISRWAQRTPS